MEYKNNTPVPLERKIFVAILIVLFFNVILILGGFYLINNRLAPPAEDFVQAQKIAKELVEYNRRLAQTLGVESRSQVHVALSQFSYDIEQADNGEDLNRAILAHGSRTQEKILEEHETRQRETVVALVNQDEGIHDLDGRERLTITVNSEGVQVEPINFLQEETLIDIAENVALGEQSSSLIVDVELDDGRARLMTPYDSVEHIRTLTREIDSLRVTLHELRSQAGYAEMSGPGVVVRIYDAEDGYTNDTIIHDGDVRDTVNELYAAGAKGISVGNQRLVNTSAIRCVGPSILVNDERIAVNPVVIRAVGDPEVLASGLEIIRITLEVSRDLEIEIEKVDNLTLPAY
ncbi:DUF881 domain-containing protein [Dethiobacter alkaliphilus]|uniref:Division initiation protein n=1 Tax=Dethiobacter alkaliphilus AHT 1 TaxID=555088 RepID=C0GEJ6_DETAL|nr:DUF881 domain-containing protein [Dethiobacter alkaliphilus]EEG78028.1 protein of unknown function DUF881 [Dethiobacter alkaliphilus AHT 1]